MPDDRLSTVGQADNYNNSPIAWFAELLIAKDRGDFRQAATAQSELQRLGWTVRHHRPRPDRKGVAR